MKLHSLADHPAGTSMRDNIGDTWRPKVEGRWSLCSFFLFSELLLSLWHPTESLLQKAQKWEAEGAIVTKKVGTARLIRGRIWWTEGDRWPASGCCNPWKTRGVSPFIFLAGRNRLTLLTMLFHVSGSESAPSGTISTILKATRGGGSLSDLTGNASLGFGFWTAEFGWTGEKLFFDRWYVLAGNGRFLLGGVCVMSHWYVRETNICKISQKAKC